MGEPKQLPGLDPDVLGRIQLDLPMLPTAASQVISMAADGETDAAALAEALHRDPTLAAGVLRVANSAVYCPRVPVASLQQAVSLLGFRQVAEIAVAVAVKGKLFVAEGQEQRIASLWRHAVAAGFFAKAIARQRRGNVETAFLCGLLHDVGMPVLLANLDVLAAAGADVSSDEALDQVLDSLSCTMGQRLAEAWQLPPSIVSAIAWHDQPGHADEAWQVEAWQACLANLLAEHSVADHSGATLSEEELRKSDAAPHLNIYPDELDQLVALCDEARAVAEEVG